MGFLDVAYLINRQCEKPRPRVSDRTGSSRLFLCLILSTLIGGIKAEFGARRHRVITMKIFLNVYGRANCGKTTAVKNAYLKLSASLPKVLPDEIEEELQLGDKRVGFVSYGDDGENAPMIQDRINSGCEVIVCASRTSGVSHDNVLRKARNNGYEIAKMSPFSYEDWPKNEADRLALINIFTEINANAIV